MKTAATSLRDGYACMVEAPAPRRRFREPLGFGDGMTGWRSVVIGISFAAAGCVHGYGGCLWTQPVKHTLAGRVHFRSYPTPDGVDNVPVLALDHEIYIYSPAQSFMCQSTDQLQLVGISEFPESVVEDSHVSVQGRLFAGTSSHDHTNFLMNVITLLPENASRSATQE
jgi:hypothetical protein